MLRAVVGVIASYVVMAIFITVLFLGGFLALGVERFFQPDVYEVSTLWLAISFLISISSAILGGYICAAISRSMKTCKVLALIIFVLGIVLCLPKMREDPVNRAGDVPILQVMQLAQVPVWAHVLTPILGAICILVGARMKKLPVA